LSLGLPRKAQRTERRGIAFSRVVRIVLLCPNIELLKLE